MQFRQPKERRLATYLSPFDRPWRVLEALLVVKGEVMLSLGGFHGVFLKSCKVFMSFHLVLKVLSKKRKLWSLKLEELGFSMF